MALIYVETNFLISIATGRDENAPERSASKLPAPTGSDIAIPGGCLSSKHSKWIEDESQEVTTVFINEMNKNLRERIKQLGRDKSSRPCP